MTDLKLLITELNSRSSLEGKAYYLNNNPLVARVSPPLRLLLEKLSLKQQIAFKQLIALDLVPYSDWDYSLANIQDLADSLVSIDEFYREIGGISGYQRQVMRLIHGENKEKKEVRYYPPTFIDISTPSQETQKAIESGISALPYLAEFYPLGGAADRLHLLDEETGQELPAAKLEFIGHTLLEGLLRDLSAREYLYFKRTGVRIITPLVIMTSLEKMNWKHVQGILEEHKWFGRPKESIRAFVQPLVPMVDQAGKWKWTSPWKLHLKPGGHGAIWKLAKDYGIFNWLHSLGIKAALIRQINNPLAGLDYGLLALAGIGMERNMSFGFSSCPRLCQAAEGINVLVEQKIEGKTFYAVSNIEYCDFAKYGLEDCLAPSESDRAHFTGSFPSNTNILFANLSALESAVEKCPFPGLLINFKQEGEGGPMGRLESTMQNIADAFLEEHDQLPKAGLRKTFITYNARHKTLSTTKKAVRKNASLNETPEQCFYDLMRAHRELLLGCKFQLPPEKTLEETLATFPSFVFLFHPALGPQFQTICQKIQGGALSLGSELILEIADVDLRELQIEGSLQIRSQYPLGVEGFSASPSKCILHNVRVMNRGVDWEHSKPFWKARFQRWETVSIELQGRSELIATDVCLQGSHQWTVHDGERMILVQDGDGLRILKELL